MGFYFFNTSELLEIECPLQLTDGSSSGCPQQSTRRGCPFGHRSAAVEPAISRRILRPMPENICIDHFLSSGQCARRPQSFAGVGDSVPFYWCPAGFHPQNLAALERIRSGQHQGLIRVNREVVCCPAMVTNLPPPLPPPPPPVPAVLESFRLSSLTTADDLVEDLDLEQLAINDFEDLVGHDGNVEAGNHINNVPTSTAPRRFRFHLFDKCLAGILCVLVVFMIIWLLVKLV